MTADRPAPPVEPIVSWCNWCPDPDAPSRAHHPGGQPEHVPPVEPSTDTADGCSVRRAVMLDPTAAHDCGDVHRYYADGFDAAVAECEARSAARGADLAQLRARTSQTCPRSVHRDWWHDGPETLPCLGCALEEKDAQIAQLSSMHDDAERRVDARGAGWITEYSADRVQPAVPAMRTGVAPNTDRVQAEHTLRLLNATPGEQWVLTHRLVRPAVHTQWHRVEIPGGVS